jgi:hypothetical protein
MAWRPSCEQGGRSSVHVAPNRVAGRRVAVVPALHRRRDQGSRSVRPIPQPRGSATQRGRRPAGSPATLVRLAGHRRDRPPPSAVRTPRCGAAAHTARTARRARLRRLRDRDPGSRAPRAGVRETCPSARLPSLQAATATAAARNQQPATPGSPGRREGPDTGHPYSVDPDLGAAGPCGAQRHDDRGGRSSAVRAPGSASVWQTSGTGQVGRERAPVTIEPGHRTLGPATRSTNANDRPDKQRDETSKTAREAVTRSSSTRQSGHVVPSGAGDDQKVRTNETRTVPTPLDDNPGASTTTGHPERSRSRLRP